MSQQLSSSKTFRVVCLLVALASAVGGIWLIVRGADSFGVPAVPENLDSLDPAIASRIREFQAALLRSPRRQDVRFQLGGFYEANRFFRLALHTYDQLLERDPENGELWFRHAICREREGDLDQAIESMEQAIKYEPEYAAAYWYQANWLIEAGDFERAKQRVEEALQLDPDDPQAQLIRARLLVSTDEVDDAIAYLQDHRESFGSNQAYADWLLGTAYRKQGDLERAAALLKLQQPPRPQWHDPWTDELSQHRVGLAQLRSTASTLVRSGKFAEAIPELQKILEQDPIDIRSWNLLGASLLNSARVNESIEAFRQAVTLNDQHFNSQLNLASALLASSSEEDVMLEALGHADLASELEPQASAAHQVRGAALEKLGRYEEALLAYQEADELDRRTPSAALAAAGVEIKLGRIDDAEKRLMAWREHRDPTPEVCLGMAYVRAAQGRRDEALKLLDEAVRLAPAANLLQSIDALRQQLAADQS